MTETTLIAIASAAAAVLTAMLTNYVNMARVKSEKLVADSDHAKKMLDAALTRCDFEIQKLQTRVAILEAEQVSNLAEISRKELVIIDLNKRLMTMEARMSNLQVMQATVDNLPGKEDIG